jgi:carotenoid 1,2-hydratase
MQHKGSSVLVQQNRLLDNGPFYRRYLSDAFIHQEGQGVQKATGISEYIYPGRIYAKWFWPFVDMRIRYHNEPPHWVQKSGRLYRWTW